MKYDDHNAMSGKRRRPVLVAVALLLLVAAGIAGIRWWREGRFHETTDDAFVAADITPVSSRVPGTLASVAARDNQRVRTGDVLAVIDDRDYRAALARAEAVVQQAEARLENLAAAADLQAAVIAQARTRIAFTAAEKQRAGSDAIRAGRLVAGNALSEQDFEERSATAAKARADEDMARAALVAAERQLAVIATQKHEAQATLAGAEADAGQARLNLEYTTIRAPVDGVVGNRQARVGAWVAAGTRLLAIVPAEGLYVEANYKESQIARIRPGQRAVIGADVWRAAKFEGRVESLSPATGAEFSLLPAENATGNFTKIVQRVPVRIRLEGSAAELGLLRPGLSVTVSVDQR